MPTGLALFQSIEKDKKLKTDLIMTSCHGAQQHRLADVCMFPESICTALVVHSSAFQVHIEHCPPLEESESMQQNLLFLWLVSLISVSIDEPLLSPGTTEPSIVEENLSHPILDTL